MGYLTATLLTDPNKRFDNQNALIAQSNDPSKVIAQIKIGVKQVYTFLISGVSLNTLFSISTIVPCLEKIVRDTRPLNSDYDDPDYDTARGLTFFGQGHTSYTTVIAGSARALCNVFEDAIKNKGSNITTLMTHCRDQLYLEEKSSWIFTPGIKCLKDLFPKIQPFHFKVLTMLQVAITTDSRVVINGVSDLLSRHCLPNLKSLELQCKGTSISYEGKHWLLGRYNEQNAIFKLYQQVINPQTILPLLEHVRLLFWCHDATQAALLALERLYPNLKSLEVDLAFPTAKKGGLKNTYSDSWDTSNTFYTNKTITTYTTTHTFDLYETKLTIPSEQETNGIPMLRSVLAKMAGQSQLECLEIIDWPADIDKTFAHQQLAEIIADGSLPRLNTIKIRPMASWIGDGQRPLDLKTVMDVSQSDLLIAVVKNVPLRELHLLMPEKTGFVDWLQYLAKYGFPLLEQFHYRVPTPYIDEKPEAHKARIREALQCIDDALTNGKLPKLTALVIEGDTPHEFIGWVQALDLKVARSQNLISSSEDDTAETSSGGHVSVSSEEEGKEIHVDGIPFNWMPSYVALDPISTH